VSLVRFRVREVLAQRELTVPKDRIAVLLL